MEPMERWQVQVLTRPSAAPAWTRDELSGRLTEISGQGATCPLTTAIGLCHEAQQQGELVAWIARADGSFHPPDVAEAGVDLESLAVVRVDSARTAARAAERLVRSGAFALVVLDLGTDDDIPIAMQGRLVSLAKRHDAAVVCLTEKPSTSPSIGSMVSLRVEAIRIAAGPDHPERFGCRIEVVKDKRHGPRWSHREERRGPAGLR
jgi:recombination protein RecA